MGRAAADHPVGLPLLHPVRFPPSIARFIHADDLDQIRWKMWLLQRKAVHVLRNRGRRLQMDFLYPASVSVSVKDVRDSEEDSAVAAFRERLATHGRLLLDKHDDYHPMLRFASKTHRFPINCVLVTANCNSVLSDPTAMHASGGKEKFEFDELKGVIEYYPQSYHATDREGWPVYIKKPGKVDRNKLMQITSVDVHVVGLKNFSNTERSLFTICRK
uniref:Uncharacterized protein n=1 Tax=Oryza meridionalis TaxID=40149 RepID=A0A0E0DD87_9ORYZ